MRPALRKRRIQLGLTHEEVANGANIDRTTYTNIELGKKNPSFAVALKIKKVLNTDSDDIFLVEECQKDTSDNKAS